MTLELDGYVADAARSLVVPPGQDAAHRLVACAQAAFDAALKVATAGTRVNEIGRAVQREARRHGFAGFAHLSELPALMPAFGSDPYFRASLAPLHKLATTLSDCGRWDEAIEVCERAIDLGLTDGTKGGYVSRIERLRANRPSERAAQPRLLGGWEPTENR